MPVYSVEIDDKGEVIGQTPAELEAIIRRAELAADGRGYGRGAQKAAEEAKKQIEDTIKARIAEFEARQPLERERYEGIEKENQAIKTRLDEMVRTHDRTLRSREEQHAEELNRRVEMLKGRDGRIQGLVREQIRGLAVAAGARDESLDEIQIIIGHQTGYDDEMNPYIKGPDGSPLQQHGKAVTLESYVKNYVDTHPHHRKTVTQRTTQTGRPASQFNQGNANGVSLERAQKRIAEGDRSPTAINEVFEAIRKKTA